MSSTGGAAESQGHHLGEYVEAGEKFGRPFYGQRDTEGKNNVTLSYKPVDTWKWAVDYEAQNIRYMLFVNSEDSEQPPREGWFYADGSKWQHDDASLTVEFDHLDICELVNVFRIGEVTEQEQHSLGNYRYL